MEGSGATNRPELNVNYLESGYMSKGRWWGVTSDAVLERLRDPAFVESALRELGLDSETVKLVAQLSPSQGNTALEIPVTVYVG